jgi:hypothetical protein
MRVENPKLVVEPGAGRTGKLGMVAYQFQHVYDLKISRKQKFLLIGILSFGLM